jgi:hypothetical protein
MNTQHSPDKELSNHDIGDDINLRFRYQAAYAAKVALGILIEETQIEEVFCEHHEDILAKRKDQKFLGIQVKTRKEGLGELKANDEVVLGAIEKFICLDKQYTDKFVRFIIATNQTFWSGANNNNNLRYVLSLKTQAGDSAYHKYAQKLLKSLQNSTFHISDVLCTLDKLVLEDDLPKLNNYTDPLVKLLGEFEEYSQLSYPRLTSLCNHLINCMSEAGSKNIDDPLRQYFAYLDNPEESLTQAVIENKRITKERLKEILVVDWENPAYLTTWTNDSVKYLAEGYKILEAKMAAGKISFQDVNLAKDHKASTEYLLLSWLNKYPLDEADKRYKHLKTIARTICQEVYLEKKRDGDCFGEEMLLEIRKRIREEYEKEKGALFGIRYEHLSGFVGMLTEECKVWWSPEFDLSALG